MKIFVDIETVPEYANRQEYAKIKRAIEVGTMAPKGRDYYKFMYGGRNPFEGKIVFIAYQVDDKPTQYLKEWKTNEETILKQFYDAVDQRNERVTFIGFNIAKFDLPFLFARMAHHRKKLAPTDYDMSWVFKKLINMPSVVDLLQMHLPLNDFSHEGLSHDVVAKCYTFPQKEESGLMIKDLYYSNPEDITKYSEKEFIYPQLFEKIRREGLVDRARFQSIVREAKAAKM